MNPTTKPSDETSTNMEMDEIELCLRRFASEDNNQGLSRLLDSMFTESAQDKARHENNPKDKMEDMKEGE